MAKFKNIMQLKERGMRLFTPKAKMIFIKLRQAFIIASIYHYLDPGDYIQIDNNISYYDISRVLS